MYEFVTCAVFKGNHVCEVVWEDFPVQHLDSMGRSSSLMWTVHPNKDYKTC